MKKLLLTLLLVSPCFASEWIDTGVKAIDLQNIYIDISSLERVPNTDLIVVWTKSLYHLKDTKSFKEENYNIAKQSFDCKNKKTKVLSTFVYNQKNDVIDSFGEFHWREVVPDSVGEGLLNFVCSEWDNKSK